MILLHELGHYLFARLFKVGIKEFAVGMGPKILSGVSKKTGIRYSLRLLPIGGFVTMLGEDEVSDSPDALCNKPVLQRIVICAAGSAFNIITGVVLVFAVIMLSPALGSNVIAEFTENAVSCDYGLVAGDRVVAIGSDRTPTLRNIVYEIGHLGDEAADITVIRDGERKVLEDVRFGQEENDGVSFGVMDFKVKTEEKNILTVIKHSFYTSVLTVKMIWESLIDLITGRYGFDALSGPVGVTTTVGNAAKQGIDSLLYLSSVLAMNLGVFNLLPIPALDGGRLFFQLVELIFRKSIPQRLEGMVHFAGIVLLMILMLIVTYQDIIKLITGRL
ncbi:MAG: site-2 protease family protein [Clostridia bacterium]|nr:site-2 protease family protein [Clostridia bacterium]